MRATHARDSEGEESTRAVRELTDSYDVEGFHGEVLEEIVSEVWSNRTEPGFRGAVDRSVHANVAAIFDVLRGQLPLHSAKPQPALELADLCAQLNIPAFEIERAYRVGVKSLWSSWAARSAEKVQELPNGAELLLVGPSLTMMTYIDHILESVIGRYEATRAELQGTRGQLRRLLVLQLLDGSLGEVDSGTDSQLAYRLGGDHVAVLLYSTLGPPQETLLRELQTAAGARDALVHQHGPHAWIVWLGSALGYGAAELDGLRRALRAAECTAAVSEPSSGLDGWRRTYEQVAETARVQRAMGPAGPRLLLAEDVRLEALLLADEARARAFVEAELGPLAVAEPSFARLRQTLLAWLSSGSHVNAAALLGVHENTIRNRVRHAEQLLEDALVKRRTELQVALRLERVLQAGPPSDRYR